MLDSVLVTIIFCVH